jgi:hypothetical protein
MSQKFRTFASNKTTKHLKIMSKVQETKLDICKVVSCGLTKEQHDIAVAIVKDNPYDFMHYDLDEVEDRELVNVWIADAFSEGREEYAHFLQKVIADGAELYTLKDELQSLGEVAIYDC